jgi:hypothetical protein
LRECVVYVPPFISPWIIIPSTMTCSGAKQFLQIKNHFRFMDAGAINTTPGPRLNSVKISRVLLLSVIRNNPVWYLPRDDSIIGDAFPFIYAQIRPDCLHFSVLPLDGNTGGIARAMGYIVRG